MVEINYLALTAEDHENFKKFIADNFETLKSFEDEFIQRQTVGHKSYILRAYNREISEEELTIELLEDLTDNYLVTGYYANGNSYRFKEANIRSLHPQIVQDYINEHIERYKKDPQPLIKFRDENKGV